MGRSEVWTAFELDVNNSADLMEECLLELEAASPDDSDSLLNRLYRALHTFKGITRMMGLQHIERLAHSAEDLVSLSRDANQLPEGECFDILFDCLAFLRREGLNAAQTQADCPSDASAALLERLERCRATQFGDVAADEAILDAPEAGFVFFDDEPDLATEATGNVLSIPAQSAPQQIEDTRAVSPRRSLPPRAPTPTSSDEYLRIHSSKIQEVLSIASELGLAAHSVTDNPEVVALASQELADATQALGRLVRELRDAAAGLALVPVRPVFSRMKLVLREAARSSGKAIRLITQGDDVEVDKSLVDRLADPLVHILRNSADHGMETPDERQVAHKRATGEVLLKAAQQGGEIVVSVSDDGRGLNRDRILKRAIANEMVSKDASLTDNEIWQLIFQPGFSTAETVSELSGRGVGMDVVLNTVKELHGYVNVRSKPGLGTVVSMHFPLTLSFLDGLVMRSGEYLFAVPLDSVQKIHNIADGELYKMERGRTNYLKVDGVLAPLCPLGTLYPARNRAASHVTEQDALVVMVHTSRGPLALPIDELLGSHQVTMKPLKGLFRGIRAASAYGILGTGEVAITLDCEMLHAGLC